jgi:hypothetical protein
MQNLYERHNGKFAGWGLSGVSELNPSAKPSASLGRPTVDTLENRGVDKGHSIYLSLPDPNNATFIHHYRSTPASN